MSDTDQLHSPEAGAHAQATKARKAAAYRAAGVPPRSGAIAAFCADCIYDPAAGGSCAAQIRACRSSRCPLWPYRPGADPLTELGQDFEASTYAGMKANKRAEYREAT